MVCNVVNLTNREKIRILRVLLDDQTFFGMSEKELLDYFEQNRENLLLYHAKAGIGNVK